MYAFGMGIYEVITGARPFGQRRMQELPLLNSGGVKPNRPEDPVAIGFAQGTREPAETCWESGTDIRNDIPWPEERWSVSSVSQELQRSLTQVPRYGMMK